MDIFISTVIIGIGATALTDIWSIARKSVFNIPPPDFGLVGRWIAHMPHGKFRHEAISRSPPVRGERMIGWTAHYLIGITFAGLLVALYDRSWLQEPTLLPALIVGIATVAAPFLIMQPGMGAGIAASRTPNPTKARIHSMIMHGVFGSGLYLAGCCALSLHQMRI